MNLHVKAEHSDPVEGNQWKKESTKVKVEPIDEDVTSPLVSLNFPCEYCENHFDSERNLRRHQEENHSGKRKGKRKLTGTGPLNCLGGKGKKLRLRLIIKDSLDWAYGNPPDDISDNGNNDINDYIKVFSSPRGDDVENRAPDLSGLSDNDDMNADFIVEEEPKEINIALEKERWKKPWIKRIRPMQKKILESKCPIIKTQ